MEKHMITRQGKQIIIFFTSHEIRIICSYVTVYRDLPVQILQKLL
jgi:hypothetical protein